MVLLDAGHRDLRLYGTDADGHYSTALLPITGFDDVPEDDESNVTED